MKNKLLLLGIFVLLGQFVSFAQCPGDTARFTTIAGICNSKSVTFVNTSVGATTYFWDFGDNTTLADTSNLQNPLAYVYPTNGAYTATLITDRNTICADTFSVVVNMAYAIASFTNTSPQCVSTPVSFINTSVAGQGSTITSYKWNFGDVGIADTSILQNPSYSYSVGNTSYTTKLIVTTSDGCKDSITSSILLQSEVVVNAGTDITTCKNNTTVTLAASIQNAGNGIWTGTGSFSSNTSLSAIYTPTQQAKNSGVDTLVLTSFSSPYCPNKSDTLKIFFNNGPTANVGSDIVVCQDVSSISVSASLNGATGVVWHTTSTEGTFVNSNLINAVYQPGATDTAAGSVILYVETTGNGICASTTDSLLVTFTPAPVVIIKTEDTVCSGVGIVLDVDVSTGAGTWTATGNGTFLPDNNALNGGYVPTSADIALGSVTLYFTSSNNGDCQPVTDTLLVTIIPSPVANFGAVSACEDLPVQFNDSSTASGTVTGWNWTFGDLSLPSFSQSPNHSYGSCGSKTVTLVVTADNGCFDSKQKSIEVYCRPNVNFTTAGVCLKAGTEFTNTTTVNNGSIATTNWSFGDGASSTQNNPEHTFAAIGSYSTTLVVVSDQGCVDSATQTLNVLAGPTAMFTVVDSTVDETNLNGGQFFVESPTSIDVFWNYGDGTYEQTMYAAGTTNHGHIFAEAGVYEVCLTVRDNFNCLDTTCNNLIVSTNAHAPTAFSPNGDGQNDVFYVIGGPFKKLEFKVYNNWGQVIFTSTNQSNGWDGNYQGVEQAIGVYVYTIDAVTENDKAVKLSGDITLLR